MNHSVHSFIKGCLTLKFSGSWKTVICSSRVLDVFEEGCCLAVVFSSPLLVESGSFAGEMGMVSSGTGELGFAGPCREEACRSVMMGSLLGSKKAVHGGCYCESASLEFVYRHCKQEPGHT